VNLPPSVLMDGRSAGLMALYSGSGGAKTERQCISKTAEQMYERALAGYEKASQSETIPALKAVGNLGLRYRDQGRLKDAEKMFQRAVLGMRKVLGLDHPYTLEMVNDLKELAALVKVKQNESSSNVTNIGHNSSRKRDRWKNLLRLKNVKVDRS
jgi:tetratricopeptide (TPR) repeat protein